MSRSRKKVCGGTNAVCKSQKKGKVACHRKFRRSKKLFYKMREVMDPWDLGGDGKQIYSFNPKKDGMEKWLRK